MHFKKDINFIILHILSPYYFFLMIKAIVKIKIFKKNISENEFQAMIKLFLISNGRSNQFFNNFLKKKIYSKNSNNDIKLQDITDKLNLKGYYVKENFISDVDTSEILRRSLQLDGYYKLDSRPDVSKFTSKFDRKNPKGTMFFYNESEIMNIPAVQKIISDPFLINIAKSYFDALPILSAVNMWWSSKFKDTPDSECAQNFHFDMDSLKWLKFFIYITDVNQYSGPHTFVEGSHKINSLPYSIRKLGYSRIDDKSVTENYGEESQIQFDKPAGTLIVEDTKGLHKGKHIEKGDRLILQLEFTSSKFLKDTNRRISNSTISNEFLNFYKNNNYLMQFYDIK